MAGSRYTRQKLFALRNHIPMNRVIEALSISLSSQEGQYRFCCPVCNNFNTGINPKTNLARCFSCQKNYNTIDLVMTIKRCGFIDSVTYLETLKTDIEFPVIKPACSTEDVRQNKMVPISDIFKSLASPGNSSFAPSQKRKDQTIIELQKRVSDLEHHVKALTEKIALIERP
ncbi:MAG: DNA primase [Desulfobacula sp.]|jgi:DNA primase|uniref:CHC2 zinc finger domain-containing protein n=3 Tax=Desulfobacula sp. TaxID=2593537 RepID=UPI001D7056C6|nr:DNA primase [Candidatus Neomarinimicrobiota bacterium]MBT4024842.1 DNA primase [Desulfobacula sp.]MBT4253950.1 DNA primase [Candidatus Neomarinimicrobiota bacterium]MBT5539913.1 DNA primase [Candidatus Neomarinimicrobiota bacterium]MBT6749596.1 DNA primase [Desulfobacula sp.]